MDVHVLEYLWLESSPSAKNIIFTFGMEYSGVETDFIQQSAATFFKILLIRRKSAVKWLVVVLVVVAVVRLQVKSI